MPAAIVVMARVHQQAETALQFEAHNVRVEYGRAAGADEFAGRKNRWNKGATGMRQ